MDDIVLPVPVSVLWESLREFRYGSFFKDGTWADKMSISSDVENVIGELYLNGHARAEDFERVPTNCDLRVVMMPQEEGFILRWLNSDGSAAVKDILGGVFHRDLLRDGDQFEEVRSGSMRVLNTGHLRIQS